MNILGQEKPSSGAKTQEQPEYTPFGISHLKLIAVSLGALFLCTLAVVFLYLVAKKTALNEVRRQLIGVASTAALQINPVKHSQLRTQADEITAIYRELKQVLIRIRVANPDIRFIYTMVSTDRPNIWQFVVDAEQDPSLVSHIGDNYDISKMSEMQQAFSGATVDNELTSDKWGVFLSGYAPIYDNQWRSIAILGLDMTQATVQSRLLLLGVSSSLIWFILTALIVFAALLYHQRTHLLKTQRDLAYQLSLTDELTQIANRRRFDLFLNFEFEVASRYGRPLSLIMGDIDFFKNYNDAFHHTAGDELLQKLAKLIQSSVRKVDLVARYGGEEFAIIMPDTTVDGAEVVAEKVRKAIESEKFYPKPGVKLVPVTMSFGIAAYPRDAKSKEDLVNHADAALYAAKQTGRNCIRLYIPQMKSS